MSQSLKKLRELTENLATSSTVIYEIKEGTAVGGGLYKDENIALQRAYMPKGSCFDKHSHKRIQEWVIVSSGRIMFTDDTGDREIVAGEWIYFPPGMPHSLKALENTYMYGLTMPSEEAYPEATGLSVPCKEKFPNAG